MNLKQKAFCEEYARSGNATQSAILAGYSKKTAKQMGSENLSKPDLQKYIQELSEKLSSERIMNAKEMQERLTAIVRQELDEEVIVVEGCGDGVSEAVTKKKKASHKDAIKAIELLGKMQGVFDNSINLNLVVPEFGGEDQLED